MICHRYTTFTSGQPGSEHFFFSRTPPFQKPYVLFFCCFLGNVAWQSVISVDNELCFCCVLPKLAELPARWAFSLQLWHSNEHFFPFLFARASWYCTAINDYMVVDNSGLGSHWTYQSGLNFITPFITRCGPSNSVNSGSDTEGGSSSSLLCTFTALHR